MLQGQGTGNALPAQPLGADDLLSLTVANSAELTRQFRVSPDGTLRLPYLQHPLPAKGLLPSVVEDEVRTALKQQKLFVDPIVNLVVVEYASRPITVMGAVRRPTTFQATAQTTLLDALARAEGLAPEAGSTVIITRPKEGGGDDEVTTVPVQVLLGQPQTVSNLRLYGGEQIRVPEAPRVYVLGNVKRPCSVLAKDPRETTVLKILAQAEGLAQFSSADGVIYRRVGDGVNEIPVDVRSILKGKSPDIRMEPYDVLYIPESRGRRLTAEVLDRVMGFGIYTASGLMVYRK